MKGTDRKTSRPKNKTPEIIPRLVIERFIAHVNGYGVDTDVAFSIFTAPIFF